MVAGAVRLRAVLEDHQVVPGGEPLQRLHVDALAVQVDRQQAPGPLGDRGLHLAGVHQVVLRAHVDEDRRRADRVDRDHGRRRGVGDGDHLVAGADPQRLQPQLDGVGAVVDADAVPGPVVAGELRLEGADTLAEDQLPGPEHRLDGVQDVLLLAVVLPQIVPDPRGHGRPFSKARPSIMTGGRRGIPCIRGGEGHPGRWPGGPGVLGVTPDTAGGTPVSARRPLRVNGGPR